ncbi:hypothetical protein [Terasakiella sp.]|uniref:hypothetical protein n=1 Tax=Terasakiella sp. TaxID=2034861 RepID=UPI003AA9C947
MSDMAPIEFILDDIDGWSACIRQHLSFLPPKALKRIVRAIKNPKSNLLPLLDEHLFNHADNTYVPVSNRVWVPAYNHEQTLEQALKNRPFTETGTDGIQYFTNTLTVPDKDDAGRYFPPPSERIINCGFYVHTFEVDPAENYQAGLAEQISWCMGGKKDTNCKIGEIYQELSRYKDFRGVEYVWSGNKSCHLHVMFDTRHLSPQRLKYTRKAEVDADLADLPDDYLRNGYMEAWDHLGEIFEAHGIMADADMALRRPEQWRRLPYGLRSYPKDSAIGIPAGSCVPQVVLWSKSRNDGRGGIDWLHQPRKFLEAKVKPKLPKKPIPVMNCDLTEDQQERFISELSILCDRAFGDPKCHPRPASVSTSVNGYTINFFNDEEDQRPSSFVSGDHDRLVLLGEVRSREKEYILPKTANDLMEYFLINDHLMMTLDKPQIPLGVERMFDAKVETPQDVRNKLGKFALLAATSESVVNSCIFTGEGASKSTSIMSAIPLYDQPGEGHIIFACQSYPQAEEKCEEFNRINHGNGYIGIALYSASKMVEIACATVGVDKITTEDIAQANATSMLDYVYDHRPEVAAWMEGEKAAMWDQLNTGDDNLRPVFFTVHAVVKQWHAVGGTRLWMHPDYAQERQKDQPNMKAIAAAMRAQWIIYDEVKMEDLMHRYPASQVKLVRKMSKRFAKLTPSEQLQAYNAVAPEHMTFDEARKIGNLKFTEKYLVTVDTSRESYGVNNTDDSPYRVINGNKYYVKFQDWWRKEEKTRITFLTTEHRIIRAMENMPDGPLVLNFDRPELFDRDEITLNLMLNNRASRDKTEELVADIKAKHPNGVIITNMSDDIEATTHDTAKGSNAFNQDGTDAVTAIYHMLSPAQYEQLLIENAVFGTKDMVKLFHLDQFNQTSGRTLGYRHNPNIKTQAIMSKRLWREIGISIEMNSRYRVRLIS